DSDSCTIDPCDRAQGCVYTPATGFAALTCVFDGGAFAPAACTPVAPSITQQIHRAGELIKLAANTTDPKARHRSLKKAAGILKKVSTLTNRLLTQKKISAEVPTALRNPLGVTSDHIKTMMRGH